MSPLFRFRLAEGTPSYRVLPGESLTVELPDSDGLGADLQPLPESRFEQLDSPPRGNPVYGPIFVEGAEPGDALRVDFLKITPDRKIARTLLAPGHGFLPDPLLREGDSATPSPAKPTHLYLWELDGPVARVTNPLGRRPVTIPIHPFLGCIGTTSPDSPPLSSLLANNHGGNIDHPDLVQGTSLWLPVSRPGGLLYLGDMHAAQGQGETAGGGLEISGEVTVRVQLEKNRPLKGLRYQTVAGWACLAVEKTFERAAQRALAEMTHWVAGYGWHLYDASMLVNQICEFRAGGLTHTYSVVSCFLPKSKLPTDVFGEAA